MNTKTSFATGWNAVNGHWPVGVNGGEEMHLLTIAEMPSHNHGLGLIALRQRANGSGDSDLTWGFWDQGFVTNYTGGSQSHNILPRFMVLAYIMKL
ncbi:hypothetical protein [Anaeromusa acidaminophila]|uniref:hypothetical protein n=1 Tax=Anaeromusa acidaminophila TaxID=81464 RepID=UPI00036ECA70|nr:hypothetical protein [Anaeromusa acidaminophila]